MVLAAKSITLFMVAGLLEIGGGYFVWRAIELVGDPGPALAMKTFFASLIQLTLLLIVAIADPWIMGLL